MTKYRALLSVTDKTGLVPFAKRLVDMGWELVSTGGTAKALEEAGLPCTLVEEVTGFPEILDGRVKTLHPKIFAGILADQRIPDHLAQLAEHGISEFAMVVVNLYLFIKKPSIENIDVGGPSLLRAAAKNFESVIVVVDPIDYDDVGDNLDAMMINLRLRLELAAKAFDVTAEYDRAISDYFHASIDANMMPAQGAKH